VEIDERAMHIVAIPLPPREGMRPDPYIQVVDLHDRDALVITAPGAGDTAGGQRVK
jgi:hypothetical protein